MKKGDQEKPKTSAGQRKEKGGKKQKGICKDVVFFVSGMGNGKNSRTRLQGKRPQKRENGEWPCRISMFFTPCQQEFFGGCYQREWFQSGGGEEF